MKKINILKSKRDFDRIIKNNKPIKYKDYIVYFERIEQGTYHFGFSVGKKIGNAVTRNRIKRQIRAMCDSNVAFAESYDLVIIAKPQFLEKAFQENQQILCVFLHNEDIGVIK